MRKMVGFTLIEVMVTVAIIAILAAVAYPSYLTHVRKSRRAEAQAALMNIASRQQQMLLDTRSYASTITGLNVTLPPSLGQSYTITLTIGSATIPTFSAQAMPLGGQLADSCGTLAVNETGVKSPSNCW